MRSLLVVCVVVFGSLDIAAADPLKLFVIDLDASADKGTPADIANAGHALAAQLTAAVHVEASRDVRFVVAPQTDQARLIKKYKCEGMAAACMLPVAKELGADRLIYGGVRSRTIGHQVLLRFLDVGAKTNTGTFIDSIRKPIDVEAWAVRALARLAP